MRKNACGFLLSFFTRLTFLGKTEGTEKAKALANAKALLFPIEWSEPFGLVLIEALMSGTPVIAFNRGSVPEIITPAVGFVVNTQQALEEAMDQVHRIDRKACRA